MVSIQSFATKEDHLEILLRVDEDKQLVPTDAFIPATEEYGQMMELDRFVTYPYLLSAKPLHGRT